MKCRKLSARRQRFWRYRCYIYYNRSISNTKTARRSVQEYIGNLRKWQYQTYFGTRKNKVSCNRTYPPSALHRRIDFLYTPPEQYAFAILYFAGSKHFNTAMRGLALKNGLSLNEHAFTVAKTGKPLSSIDPDASFKTELDIFNYLDMEYGPTERINDKSVI